MTEHNAHADWARDMEEYERNRMDEWADDDDYADPELLDDYAAAEPVDDDIWLEVWRKLFSLRGFC